MLTILDPVELQYCAKRVETLIIKEGFSVSESCIFRIRDGNDFSQFGQTEVNETQGYAISRYKLFTILLVTPTQINYHGDYHSIVCHHLSPTNRTSTPELNKVWFSR